MPKDLKGLAARAHLLAPAKTPDPSKGYYVVSDGVKLTAVQGATAAEQAGAVVIGPFEALKMAERYISERAPLEVK